MMRAVVIAHSGGPEVLQLQQRPVPEPGPGEIRVRVRTSAMNRADLLQRRGGYPAPPGAPPDIPGLEYAGHVDAVGPGAGLWAVGNRVMGIVAGGGHAEYLCVHEREAIRIPQNLTWEEAGAIPEVFITAYDALFHRLGLRGGERLLIHAVGSGVGTAALQLAREVGATVVGTSRTADKLRRAAELGLHLGIDTSRGGWTEAVQTAPGIGEMQAVLDLVGGSYFAENLQVLAPQGRIAVIGTTAGARAELDLSLLLRKRVQLSGSVLRTRPLDEKVTLAREFSKTVLPLFTQGSIHPVVDRVLPFAEIVEAHRYMETNQSFGKIVLRW